MLLTNRRAPDRVESIAYKIKLLQAPSQFCTDQVLPQHKVTSTKTRANNFYDDWPGELKRQEEKRAVKLKKKLKMKAIETSKVSENNKEEEKLDMM